MHYETLIHIYRKCFIVNDKWVFKRIVSQTQHKRLFS